MHGTWFISLQTYLPSIQQENTLTPFSQTRFLFLLLTIIIIRPSIITTIYKSLIKESQHLPSSLLPPSLLMCHNTISGRHNYMSELTWGQKVNDPFLDFANFNIETGGDDTTLVKTSVEFNNDLLGTVIIDDFEFTNVSCFKFVEDEAKRRRRGWVSMFDIWGKCNRLKGGSFSLQISLECRECM